MSDEIREASAELAAELDDRQKSTPSQMREAIEIYHAMTKGAIVRWVDPLDGEVVEIPLKDYERRVADQKARVKFAMRDNETRREQLEGLPGIKLQAGSGRWQFSIDAWYANEHDRADLLKTISAKHVGALDVTKAKAAQRAGEIPGTWQKYAWQGGRDDALVWEE